MFSVSDDVLLYGTSSVEPQFSITKTDDDSNSLKFKLSNGNTLFNIQGEVLVELHLVIQVETNFFIRKSQKYSFSSMMVTNL